jgi:flagellar motor switch protein FliN
MDGRPDARYELLLDALVSDLSVVIGGLLQSDVESARSAPKTRSRWYVEFKIGGALRGRFVAGFQEKEARELARALEDAEQPPADSVVVDALLEVCRQAASSVCQRPVGTGITIEVEACARPSNAPSSVHELKSPLKSWLHIACWYESNRVTAPASASWPADASLANLDVIMDIELPLIVRFGEKDMTLHSLTRLGPGSIIDLGRSPDEPVEVMINDRLVARGEVVAVGGNYGVRITEVLSTMERIRSLAG